jgi:hypothetical protein
VICLQLIASHWLKKFVYLFIGALYNNLKI